MPSYWEETTGKFLVLEQVVNLPNIVCTRTCRRAVAALVRPRNMKIVYQRLLYTCKTCYHSFLGCSYLFEVQNEVHNNSSLEIYYQVCTWGHALLVVCSVTDLWPALRAHFMLPEWKDFFSFLFFLSVTCKPPKVTSFWSCFAKSSVNRVLTHLELRNN